MAYVGLRKPIIAVMLPEGGYGEPFACGKAIGITVTPSFAEASLYADDIQAEYDKEFKYADVTMNTSTLPLEAHERMFGHKIGGNSESEINYNANDEQSYVGMGWISSEKIDGKRKYVGNFLNKAKFSEPSEDYSTKGDNIEYKTPSISGRALALDNGDWKKADSFETEKEAIAYVYKLFGKELKTLNVKSAEGQTTGKTKLTVTPAKEEENTYFYRTGAKVTMPAYNDLCDGTMGWMAWDGTSEITAKTGDKLIIVEVTAQEHLARSVGEATVTAKA